MAQVIKIKKGLNINLKGKPQRLKREAALSQEYTIYPDDFSGFVPKVAVKPGDRMLAGTEVLFDKNRPGIKIVSPVSGEVLAVNRGEKRRLLSIVIQAGEKQEYKNFGKKGLSSLSPEAIRQTLAEAGIFAYIRQRPYDIVADPDDVPRDIFVSGFSSAPLAPDMDFVLEREDADFQTGLDALAALTAGKVYLGIRPDTQASCLKNARNVEIVTFDGPHPAGNVGVQINHIRPVNKGEIVWTVSPECVLYIGRLFNKGIADFSRWVALTGSEINESGRAYYPMLPGACIENQVKDRTNLAPEHLRFISGNVLTGTQIAPNGSLHAYDNQLTVIPEGNNTHDFLGWMKPGFRQFSVSRTFPAFLVQTLIKKEYTIDARIKGGRRAMIMSNEWEKVFPMDILPEFLIRAILSGDIDKMENLGIYEVAPEDFALCEFVDTSKMELQAIVRRGLDLIYKENK
ncbi:MAG: Na(+)-translocating NADH-quinone reductase subunit A [Dysgonamonadaceae bacterium]|jgi:Na+-transporting NADH:ubiquinone oxidoreductase subunit A|nr:Na(+)-translocating NADH-quinone reductase subunit A [Dysgonamonadaceae bacterium]